MTRTFFIWLIWVGSWAASSTHAEAQSEAGVASALVPLGMDAGTGAAPASEIAAPTLAASPALAGVLEEAPSLGEVGASQLVPGARALDVEVRGLSRNDRLRRSALAVTVIDVAAAKRGATDLGEVLARVEGVSVRRAGGLGSDQRFSLAGLEGEQIRFFLDGLPLEYSGYPFGVANVPVNTLERVEIYRGVVPIRLGADALGGALNLTTKPPAPGVHGSASYLGGSFDTHRGTLSTSYAGRGLFYKLDGFADYSANDYPITVDGALADGTPTVERVRRFHDAYGAEGASLTVGTIRQRWAERLSLRTFFTHYDKELQSDPFMNQPYGAASSGGATAGVSASYKQHFSDRVELDLAAGYTYALTRLRDLSMCIYDWRGRCTPSAKAGEIREPATDAHLQQHATLLRANLGYAPFEGHKVGFALAPTYVRRGGDDHYEVRPGARDPLDADRQLTTLVSGLDYTISTLAEQLEAVAFAKSYVQYARSEELLRNGTDIRRDRDTQRFGAGASLRYAPLTSVWLKGSYEYATRLPSADEVFGNGVLISQNLELEPERSHNVNLSIATDRELGGAGRIGGELLGFLRDTDQLIFLAGNAMAQAYQNAASARSLGGQLSASFTSQGDYLRLDANGTYQSFRNTSQDGAFALYKGDRMPYRPYLFANTSVRGQLPALFSPVDLLSLTWSLRYTHSFFRNWESFGRRDTKDVVPKQVVHFLTLTYLAQRTKHAAFSMSIEVQNLSNERVFDFFGVEKPGRAVFAKCVAEL